MKTNLPALMLATLVLVLPAGAFGGVTLDKEHDYLPRFHNVIFIFDVSDSMMAGYPKNFDHTRLFVATRAFSMFNNMMPHISRWQYDVNAALITYGDCKVPRLLSPLAPWNRNKYVQFYNCMRHEDWGPYRTAALQDGLQLAGQLMGTVVGRTAIVVFTDGGTMGECPQKTATALKNKYGDKVQIFGVFFGESEVGWRNLYETCKLTGGYSRWWEDVRTKSTMKEFAWDITIREIMFPYPEVFFQTESAELLPSEAMKLESVANFLRAIPQYQLQIDGHTNFLGDNQGNLKLGMDRAKNVKEALVKIFCVSPERIQIRSWGEELPRYDNQNPEFIARNDESILYLKLPLRNFPYDEKNLHTFGRNAVGDIYNTQERDLDTEWAWPDKPVAETTLPIRSER
jgi:outer membrane protein OmpA-like peptidoglycan-associated protein